MRNTSLKVQINIRVQMRYDICRNFCQGTTITSFGISACKLNRSLVRNKEHLAAHATTQKLDRCAIGLSGPRSGM